jgi:hypothetical protein
MSGTVEGGQSAILFLVQLIANLLGGMGLPIL